MPLPSLVVSKFLKQANPPSQLIDSDPYVPIPIDFHPSVVVSSSPWAVLWDSSLGYPLKLDDEILMAVLQTFQTSNRICSTIRLRSRSSHRGSWSRLDVVVGEDRTESCWEGGFCADYASDGCSWIGGGIFDVLSTVHTFVPFLFSPPLPPPFPTTPSLFFHSSHQCPFLATPSIPSCPVANTPPPHSPVLRLERKFARSRPRHAGNGRQSKEQTTSLR